MRLGGHERLSYIRCGCAVHSPRTGNLSPVRIGSFRIGAWLCVSLAVLRFILCNVGRASGHCPVDAYPSPLTPYSLVPVRPLSEGSDLRVSLSRTLGGGRWRRRGP